MCYYNTFTSHLQNFFKIDKSAEGPHFTWRLFLPKVYSKSHSINYIQYKLDWMGKQFSGMLNLAKKVSKFGIAETNSI